MSENQRFSDVFRGCRNVTLGENRFRIDQLDKWTLADIYFLLLFWHVLLFIFTSLVFMFFSYFFVWLFVRFIYFKYCSILWDIFVMLFWHVPLLIFTNGFSYFSAIFFLWKTNCSCETLSGTPYLLHIIDTMHLQRHK